MPAKKSIAAPDAPRYESYCNQLFARKRSTTTAAALTGRRFVHFGTSPVASPVARGNESSHATISSRLHPIEFCPRRSGTGNDPARYRLWIDGAGTPVNAETSRIRNINFSGIFVSGIRAAHPPQERKMYRHFFSFLFFVVLYEACDANRTTGSIRHSSQAPSTGDISRPRFHQFAASLKQVCSSVCAFHGAAFDMR